MSGMSQDATIETFRRDGVVAMRGFLSREEVDDLMDGIDRYVREIVPDLPPDEVYFEQPGRIESLQRLNRMERYDSQFDRLRKSDRFVKLANALLGEAARPQHMLYFTKPARVGKVTPPHQDAYYWMIAPPVGITYWLSLGTADESNGCMRYVKGSHKLPLRAHADSEILGFSQMIIDYGKTDEQAEVAFCAEPGDLLVHDGRTIHRADGNESERPRPALGLVYVAATSQQDRARSQAYQQNLHEKLKEEGKI